MVTKLNKDTEDIIEKIIVKCPYEPLLDVPISCTKNCSKCLIKDTGGLYRGLCGYID